MLIVIACLSVLGFAENVQHFVAFKLGVDFNAVFQNGRDLNQTNGYEHRCSYGEVEPQFKPLGPVFYEECSTYYYDVCEFMP